MREADPEYQEGVKCVQTQGKNTAGRSNSTCKGPGLGLRMTETREKAARLQQSEQRAGRDCVCVCGGGYVCLWWGSGYQVM